MFYVSEGKVYLATKDVDLGIYPQVDVVRQRDGTVRFNSLMTGVTERPFGREVCTSEEVIARYAHDEPEQVNITEPEAKVEEKE